MPEISVIIPTYGVPDRLRRTVGSVLEQTFRDFEVIVVDDNNPDTDSRRATEALMRELEASDSRVRYLQHEKNRNGSAARNTGIRAARGRYISLLDSDDEYTPDRLEKCLKAMKEQGSEKVQGVYTGCEYRKGEETYRRMTGAKSGNFMVDYLKLTFNLYTGSNIFITKEAADALNGFDESFTRHQDVEFMIRFFEKYDIIGLPEVLVIKHFDGKNKPTAEKMETIKNHFLETFRPLIESLPEREQQVIYSAHYRQMAEHFTSEKKYRRAREYYRKVRRNHCMTAKYMLRAVVYFARSLKS